MMVSQYRDDFPIFKNSFDPSKIIYFDNAATTQKPIHVINKVHQFYTKETSSISRGFNSLAEKNTLACDETRQKFAEFINASPEEIIFTHNCTHAINTVASGLDFSKQNEILISLLEHHSNFLPWNERGNVKIVETDPNGIIDLEKLSQAVNGKTKIISTTYVSNVTGNIQPVEDIVEIAHRNGILSLVDAAQAVSHIPIDVKKINCDFMTFSAHKMFGPSGVGVLYGKKESLKSLTPQNWGGGMVNKITPEHISYQPIPYIFEAGTPNIEGILGLGGALNYLFEKNISKIAKTLHSLDTLLIARMKELNFIEILFPISDKHIPIITFRPKSSISIDFLSSILSDSHNIFLRSGYHCAQPLFTASKISGGLRISLQIYNTEAEIHKFISILEQLEPLLK